MSYLEKDFQTEFNKWLKYHFDLTAAFELKLARGNSLPFDALAEHQRAALHATKYKKVIYKIPDSGFQNPYDCFSMCREEAYVVIAFSIDGKPPKEFVMIDIDNWIDEEKESKRKSITIERAKEIGIAYNLGKQKTLT